MDDTSTEADEEVITFNGKDIRKLRRAELIDALRGIYPEITAMKHRLSDEGRMEAAREEDFERSVRAQREYFGTVAEYQSRIFDASTAYNQIIVIGGYAAFFSIWAAFSKELSATVILWSAGLVTASLVIYVTWTVIGMYALQAHNVTVLGTFADGVEGFEERYRVAAGEGQQKSARLMRFWRPVLWSSGLTGFAAAALLGSAALWTAMPKFAPPLPDPIVAASKRADEAAARAECNARTSALYARSRGGVGTVATNPKTGEHAVLVEGKWVVLPRCAQ